MQHINKDILTVSSGVIGHSVNSVGVMGAGLALAIRNKWPKVYRYYMAAIDAGELCPGGMQTIEVSPGLYVANIVGQERYGRERTYTDYTLLRKGLAALQVFSHMRNLPVYLPYGIGCGLGGGNWDVVSQIIEQTIPAAIVCKHGAA